MLAYCMNNFVPTSAGLQPAGGRTLNHLEDIMFYKIINSTLFDKLMAFAERIIIGEPQRISTKHNLVIAELQHIVAERRNAQ